MERFEQKYEPCPITGCWLWKGALGNADYGSFVWDHGKRPPGGNKTKATGRRVMNAHHAAWLLYRGEIPAGLEVRHTCEGGVFCVNPEHMRLGTHQQNTSDMVLAMWKKGNPAMGTKKRHGRFVARFKFKNRYIYCGQYATCEEAHEASKARSIPLHFEEANRPVEAP